MSWLSFGVINTPFLPYEALTSCAWLELGSQALRGKILCWVIKVFTLSIKLVQIVFELRTGKFCFSCLELLVLCLIVFLVDLEHIILLGLILFSKKLFVWETFRFLSVFRIGLDLQELLLWDRFAFKASFWSCFRLSRAGHRQLVIIWCLEITVKLQIRSIVLVCHKESLLKLVKIQVFNELLEAFVFLLQLYEELLGVAPCLSTWPSCNMLLDKFPFLSVPL